MANIAEALDKIITQCGNERKDEPASQWNKKTQQLPADGSFAPIFNNCEKHGEWQVNVKDESGRNPRGFFLSECPDCKVERLGHSRVKSNGFRGRLDNGVNDEKQKVVTSPIPKRFSMATFDNYRAANEKQAGIRDKCIDYANDFLSAMNNGRSLVLTGNSGNGKTHLAFAVAKSVMEKGYGVQYMTFHNLCSMFREVRRFNSDKTELTLIAELTAIDFLVIDEIGISAYNSGEQGVLINLINERYLELKPTMLISNMVYNDFEKMLSVPGMDRVRDNGGVILSLDWETKRG